MTRHAHLLGMLAVALILSPSPLLAQCADQPRKVVLDKDNVVPLKSYLCSAGSGTDTAQFRAEYYRLSDVAVSLLLANASSDKLRKTLGAAKILPNDVSRTYADLVKRLGATEDVPKNERKIGASLTLTPADKVAAVADPTSPDYDSGSSYSVDTMGTKKLRTFLGLDDPGPQAYPAIEEIAALRKKTIPNNLGYYYSFQTGDCVKGDFSCKKFGDATIGLTLWRYMTAVDVNNYGANVKAYNQQLMQVRKNKKDAKDDQFQADALDTAYYDVVKNLGQGAWPNDFLLMTGTYQVEDCGSAGEGDLPGLAGWSFITIPRVVRIEAVLLQNLSKQPLSISGLFGSSDATATLHAVDLTSGPPANPAALEGVSGTIAPGQSAIVLTKILLLVPDYNLADFRKYRESMDAIHTAFGSAELTGNVAAYAAPDPKAYAYGPTMTITGATVNSVRVDFTSRPLANFLQLTYGSEVGSCPYLLSWDDSGGEWITHGKVLHKGQGKANAYTETISFPGLRTRFRIEEREPEIAHVKQPTLVLKLFDDSTRRFAPIQPAARASQADLTLIWGQAADIVFALPEDLKASEVTETRLEVTGYYERYSNLLAAQEPEAISTPLPVRINYDVTGAELGKPAPASRRAIDMQPRQ